MTDLNAARETIHNLVSPTLHPVTDDETAAVVEWCHDWLTDTFPADVEHIANQEGEEVSAVEALRLTHHYCDGGLAFVLADVRETAQSPEGFYVNHPDKFGPDDVSEGGSLANVGRVTRPEGLDNATADRLGIDADADDIRAGEILTGSTTKWLLSADPEIESHPWTLVQVSIPDFKPLQVIQVSAESDPLYRLEQASRGELDAD